LRRFAIEVRVSLFVFDFSAQNSAPVVLFLKKIEQQVADGPAAHQLHFGHSMNVGSLERCDCGFESVFL